MRKLLGKYGILLALALIIFTSCDRTKKKTAEEPQGPVVIAYIEGGETLDAARIEADKLTHINYASATVKDGKATLSDTENIKVLTGLKTDYPNLKVLISVAARDWAKSFGESPLTPDIARGFAKTVVDIVKTNDLDGVDINWGYPVAANLKDTLSNTGLGASFLKAIVAVREELNALEKETEKTYKLSCAVEASSNYIQNAGMQEAQQHLDFINVMAYNFQDAKVAINQAGLHPSDKYNIRKAASVVIEEYMKAGVTADKLVLGMPFYGNVYQVKKNSQTGLGDPVVKMTGTKGYTFIKDSLINKNEYFRYWDNAAQAPYVYNFYKSELITYDDEESVKAKCQYVKDNKLAGVMFWEYNSDPKGFLLAAVNQALK